MLDVMFSFEGFFGSFFAAFFSSFYYGLRFFIFYLDWGSAPGFFWVYFITQILIVALVIIQEVRSGRVFILSFLLCLSIPLLGAFVIIVIISYIYDEISRLNDGISEMNTRMNRNTDESKSKRCKICKKELSYGYTSCPHCGSKELESI